MSMQAESLEILEKADVPPGQARAIVRAIEIELAGARDTLATKHDILLLRQELREEILGVRSELHNEISGVRGELLNEISGVRGELRGKISGLGSELRQEMAEMRGAFKAEIHASASGITRQMYGALLGQMAVLLGIAYFFVTHVI